MPNVAKSKMPKVGGGNYFAVIRACPVELFRKFRYHTELEQSFFFEVAEFPLDTFCFSEATVNLNCDRSNVLDESTNRKKSCEITLGYATHP